MQKKKLKAKILKVLKKYPVGSVATIKSGKPWVRYMLIQPREDLTLYTTSFASARKIAQIKKDKNVHIAFGLDPAKWERPYVNVVGKAEILTDVETKRQCWEDFMEEFYEGPEDPDLVVIKITPTLIEYMSPDATEPEVYRV